MAIGTLLPNTNLLSPQVQNGGQAKRAESLTSQVMPAQETGQVSKKAAEVWKAGDPKVAEARAILLGLREPCEQLEFLRLALMAAGPASSANIASSHARYLLGERPSSPPQAQLFDGALALMQKISARRFNPDALEVLSKRIETFAKDPVANIELGKRVSTDFNAQFDPATAAEVSTLLTLAENAKASGNSRMALAIAAFLPQVAAPKTIGPKNAARQEALRAEDVLAVSLLSQATATHFFPVNSSAIAASVRAYFPDPPAGASAEVKAMYSEGTALVQELVTANRKQFTEAFAQGDPGLQKPASYAVNPRNLERFAGLVEKARSAGLIELEMTLTGQQKVLFPGLGLATAAEAKGFAPTLARIQSANQHFTGSNASGEERVSSGLTLMIGARPSDPAKAKLYDSVKPILARQLGTLRGNASLDGLSEGLESVGLPNAAIHFRQQAVLQGGDKKELLALVDAVNVAVKAGDTRFAQGVAMAGLTAFPMALASNDAQMRDGAERLATVWDGEPLIQKACEPLLAKFSNSLPAFQRLEGEQTKVLQALEKRVDDEFAQARAHNRAPDATALKKLSAQAIATQQAFALKSDQRMAELFTAVERDQIVGLAGLLGTAFEAAAKDPAKTDALRDSISAFYGPKFATFFDDFNTSQKNADHIAGTIETIRRKADVASQSGPALRPAGSNPALPSVSAQTTELAKRYGYAPADLEDALRQLIRMPSDQFEKYGSTMRQDQDPVNQVARALYDEAKTARGEVGKQVTPPGRPQGNRP